MTIYAPPGSPDSLVTVSSPLRQLHRRRVGRTRRRASTSRTSRPVNGKPFAEVARGTAEDIEKALDAAHAAAARVGQDLARPSARNVLNKIADRIEAEPRDCSPSPRPGTTASPSARRSPPTCRWPSTTSATSPAASAPRRARIAEIDEQHRRLPLPRAARRRRPDHPVELPDPDGRVEARAGARRRQLRRAQARRADPVVDPRADGADRRPAAARRAQHRQRLRRRGRQAAGLAARASPRSPSPARRRPAA